jgi:ArsR family transcriptional regulator
MKLDQSLLSREQLTKAAKVLKVLAHPVKLEILQVLRDHPPMDVSSLCKSLGAECEISMMSHHLAKMKDNGVLESVKRGKQVFYSIADRSLLSIFECMSKCALI